jgi:predicted histidine transporter YuiF (NhaC family)
MNTQLAFAFGMLAMIAIGMIIVIVVGMVKVYRHDKEFKNVQEEIGHIHRHITETERDFQTSLTVKQNRFEQYTEELKRELVAYTDSRIDKALGTTKKQILND